ncbi:hypothetical protein D9615_004087 [Tricholomella constricta]|uniref:Uncharacterized protein n=1 Tax=Tricholomella constricta TaxID=117010 RepID=A0A8H5HCL9_9AGAR|nr:hypothetical protein D9615_004087 [Tricholomella constricta]
MNPTPPSHNDPSILKRAAVGTSIQLGADMLVNLIDIERADAARVSREQYAQLEKYFTSYRSNALATVAAEQAKVQEAHGKLLTTQALLTQYQHYVASSQGTVRQIQSANAPQAHPCQGQMQQTTAQSEEPTAKRRLDVLQHALQDVGIIFCEDNSIRFEAGWAAVLAQLEARDCGVMNAGRLHEVLGQLTSKLQQDRETISQLKHQVLTLDDEKKHLVEKYELEIQCLKLEISMLQDAASSQSPTPATSIMPQTSPSTAAVCNAPGILPSAPLNEDPAHEKTAGEPSNPAKAAGLV